MQVLSSFDLTGKHAVITGCNRGIGKAIALGLAEAGADITGMSASLALAGSEVEQAVLALGRSFTAYQADFSQREQVLTFTRQVRSDFPEIDILINNAKPILTVNGGRMGAVSNKFVVCDL